MPSDRGVAFGLARVVAVVGALGSIVGLGVAGYQLISQPEGARLPTTTTSPPSTSPSTSGTGTSPPTSPPPPPPSTLPVTVVDIDNDHHADFVIRGSTMLPVPQPPDRPNWFVTYGLPVLTLILTTMTAIAVALISRQGKGGG
jgi:hypothetical protein